MFHPLARKMAKGWGTELVQNHAVGDLAEVESLAQSG
jgi:hypothetical protein